MVKSCDSPLTVRVGVGVPDLREVPFGAVPQKLRVRTKEIGNAQCRSSLQPILSKGDARCQMPACSKIPNVLESAKGVEHGAFLHTARARSMQYCTLRIYILYITSNSMLLISSKARPVFRLHNKYCSEHGTNYGMRCEGEARCIHKVRFRKHSTQRW